MPGIHPLGKWNRSVFPLANLRRILDRLPRRIHEAQLTRQVEVRRANHVCLVFVERRLTHQQSRSNSRSSMLSLAFQRQPPRILWGLQRAHDRFLSFNAFLMLASSKPLGFWIATPPTGVSRS